jgi:hypothetical protein
LQILLFPLQTSGSTPGEEGSLASAVFYFPILSSVVEFDVAGPGDFKPPEFM